MTRSVQTNPGHPSLPECSVVVMVIFDFIVYLFAGTMHEKIKEMDEVIVANYVELRHVLY